MKSDDAITVANTGKETLHICSSSMSKINPARLSTLLNWHLVQATIPRPASHLSPRDLTAKICDELSQALVKEGLYPREATAMVDTWKSSWFAEDGTRVLYVLPRAWTDRTLACDQGARAARTHPRHGWPRRSAYPDLERNSPCNSTRRATATRRPSRKSIKPPKRSVASVNLPFTVPLLQGKCAPRGLRQPSQPFLQSAQASN